MRRFVVAVLVSIFIPTACLAWGEKGHKVVATIALNYLSENARSEVEDLLGDTSQFVELSIWADQVRFSRPDTAPWHFVDIPFDGGAFNASRDCPNLDCVVAKIAEFTQTVGNKQLAKPVRAEALKWLIHFVGDVHQPLHSADDNDRGGNEVWVRIGGKTDRLHSLWDTGLVNQLGDTPTDIATALIGEISDVTASTWRTGTAADWANESFHIAHAFIYARSRGKNTKSTPIFLPDSYFDDATPYVSQRIEMASVRLAWILNQGLR